MDPVHLIPIQSFSHLWLLRLILSDLHVCVSLFSRSLSSQRSCWKHLFRSEVAISSSTNNRLVLSLLLLKLVVLLRLVVPLVVLQKLCRVYLTDSIQTNWPMAIELGCNPGGWLHAGSALLPPPPSLLLQMMLVTASFPSRCYDVSWLRSTGRCQFGSILIDTIDSFLCRKLDLSCWALLFDWLLMPPSRWLEH